MTLGNLGTRYIVLGEAHKALSMFKRSLGILEKHYGRNHLKVAFVLNNLSVCFTELGEVQDSKLVLERAF